MLVAAAEGLTVWFPSRNSKIKKKKKRKMGKLSLSQFCLDKVIVRYGLKTTLWKKKYQNT